MYHGIHDISNVSNLLGGFMKKLIRCLFIVCILCFSISPVYARAGGGGGVPAGIFCGGGAGGVGAAHPGYRRCGQGICCRGADVFRRPGPVQRGDRQRGVSAAVASAIPSSWINSHLTLV